MILFLINFQPAFAVLFVFTTLLLIYYCFVVTQKPKLYAGKLGFREFLNTYLSVINRKYWPAFFFWDGRLQTIFGLSKRMENSEKLHYEREIFTAEDGGQFALDFIQPPYNCANESTLLVILLPGLGSSSQTSYVKTITLSIMEKAGASVVVLNHRGLAGVPLTNTRTYCGTYCGDLRETIRYIKQKSPDTRLMAVGTSLGGIILARYLTEYPDEAKSVLISAMLVSIIWDPWACAKNIETPLNFQLINRQIVKGQLLIAKKYEYLLNPHESYDYYQVLNCKTMREIDEKYTAPLYGYRSIEEYYDHLSLAKDIDKLSIPVIALHAYDDPLQPGDDLPTTEANKIDSNLALLVTNRGGHLGFLEGWLPRKNKVHLMEKAVSQFVRAVRLHGNELT